MVSREDAVRQYAERWHDDNTVPGKMARALRKFLNLSANAMSAIALVKHT